MTLPLLASFRFFYLGVFLILAGILSWVGSFWPGIAFLPAGLWLVISPEQIELDKSRKRFRKGLYVGINLGSWKDYSSSTCVYLDKLHVTHAGNLGPVRMSVVRTRSYEVWLGDKPRLLLEENTDYKKAVKALERLSKVLELPAENRYKEKLDRAREKRGG